MNRFFAWISLAIALPILSATCVHAADPVMVSMTTSKGDVMIELMPEKSPQSVANFLQYIEEGFYDGTVFHRVIPGFMVQAGGRDLQLKKKSTRDSIVNEASNGLLNDRYTLAMARTGDPNSATSQFFVNTADNAGLNRPNPDGHGYAVFGKVVAGFEVIDAIEKTPTGKFADPDGRGAMLEDVPTEPITIESMTLVSGGQ